MKDRQNCSECKHVNKCFALRTNAGTPVSHRNVMINILVCRLKLRINTDETAETLMAMLRPGMVRLITNSASAAPSAAIDFDTMLADMRSETIYLLSKDYSIGDFLVATAYLLGPTGKIVKWAKWYTSRAVGYNINHELMPYLYYDRSSFDEDGEETVDTNQPAVPDDSEDDEAYAPAALAILDDGVTLSSREHRVLAFCLQNANETLATRHIDGLHIALARFANVSRPRITRIYRQATAKLRAAMEAE